MAYVIRLFALSFIFVVHSLSVSAQQAATEASYDAVAVFPKNFPPEYQVSPEGEPYGFAIEVMEELAARADLRIKYHPVENWGDVWKLIRSGQADLVPNMGITSERGESLFFTKPYESFEISIFVNKETKGVNDLKDLAGKKVGTVNTNIANSLAKGVVPLIRYSTAEQCIQALVNRRLDAVILPKPVAVRIAASQLVSEQIVTAGKPLVVVQRAVAVNKSRPELYKLINSEMNSYLDSEEFTDTQQSWGREWQKGISIEQLIKLNALLATILVIGVALFANSKLKRSRRQGELKAIEFRVISLIGVLFLATALISAFSLWFLYDTAFEGQKSRLVNIVQSRARIIESFTRVELSHRELLGVSEQQTIADTLNKIRESHQNFPGFGQTGEFTFAKRMNNEIVFILQQRHSITVKPQNIPWISPDAEPMRRALSGRSGTLVGLDYRGVAVLAAHEPVRLLDAGIVAKIDLAEIRQPYIRAAFIILAVTLMILAAGIVLFYTLTSPIIDTLSKSYSRLKAIIDHSPGLIVISDNSGKRLFASPSVKQLQDQLPEKGESTVTHIDGSVHTYLSSQFPLIQNGRQFGSCQISTDITARVVAESERKQLAMAFQSTSEAVVVTDINSNILTVNKAFLDITGYELNEVIGNSPRLLQSGRHDKKFYRAMWHSIQKTGGWRGEIWNRRKNGEAYPEWLNISTVYDDDNQPCNYIAVFSDITAQKESQDQLYYLAYHDPLTKLPNRLLFRDRLEYFLRQAHRQKKIIALFAIDLDRFKNINDSLGHLSGDKVLKEAANRLQSLVRDSDTVARMGGDEFTVIADGFNDYHAVSTFANKVVRGMSYTADIDGQQIMNSISLGVAVYPQDGATYEELLKNADSALYKAKDLGRNNYQFYTEELSKSALENLIIENKIQHGLEHNEFVIFYQPQFDVQSGELVSAEALVRWQHPEFGLLSPDRFIPLAEESGLIIPLGEWILKAACEQAQDWLESGYKLERIAVNLSGYQIERAGLFESIKSTLESTGLPANKLELEVTEGFIMREVKESIHLLESLNRLGIAISIDDFGTGYSSLAYLKRLPVTTLKIDRSFIQDLTEDNEDAAIAKAVIALGHSLGMTIIAEGVEKQSQWDFLKKEGCDLMQGFLLGKPVPADTFENECFDRKGKE